MTYRKLILPLFVFCATLFSASMIAQEEQDALSEKEMAQFAEVFIDIQSISEDARGKMVKALDDVGMGAERFNEIQQMAQDPENELTLSEEEEMQLQKANQSLQEIQMGAQQEMQKAIVDKGMSVEKYQQIAAQVQTNPELQQKIQSMMVSE